MAEKLIPVRKGADNIFTPNSCCSVGAAAIVAVKNPDLCKGCDNAAALEVAVYSENCGQLTVGICSMPAERRLRCCKVLVS